MPQTHGNLPDLTETLTQAQLRPWTKPRLSVTDVKSLTKGRNTTRLDNSGDGTQTQDNGSNSDRRLKRDMVQIGNTVEGVAVYRFRYLWSSTQMVGVMAQDILDLFPAAVTIGPHGYYHVNYKHVGIDCIPYDLYLEMLTVDPLANGIIPLIGVGAPRGVGEQASQPAMS